MAGMCADLTEAISKCWNPRKANLQALISCATTRLDKLACNSISDLGCGEYNVVYKLSFNDGTAIAASVSIQRQSKFNPRAKLSEFATMEFVRKTGLYPEIRVPDIYAFDISFLNPVGFPYTLMQLLEGKTYESIRNEHDLTGIDLLSQADQLAMVKAFAKLQASLIKPVPFSKIGSIALDDSGNFSVGPLFDVGGRDKGGPYDSIEEFWRGQIERTMLDLVEEQSNLSPDQLMPLFWDNDTPRDFSRAYQRMAALIPYFIPPSPYLQLVLHHPDLAFRNVFFDPQDYSRIIGIIDWTGAQILPLMLTAQFPHDIRSDSEWPLKRVLLRAEQWNSVPYDWTSLGDTSRYPYMINRKRERVDFIPKVKAMVRQYYLRQYFTICYAESIQTIYGDNDLARATVFADSLYYLKFNEVITSASVNWAWHSNWVEETYWRLRANPPNCAGDSLIFGPNFYRQSDESDVCDLGLGKESGEYWGISDGIEI